MHFLVPKDTRRARRCRSASGLSLVELLLAMMIIGIIGSLVLMVLSGGFSDEVVKQKDKRNAQTIANLAVMASAAGASYVVAGDEEATVENLRTGCSPTSGAFKGRVFKLPSMEAEDIQGALTYLRLTSGGLMYNSTGADQP